MSNKIEQRMEIGPERNLEELREGLLLGLIDPKNQEGLSHQIIGGFLSQLSQAEAKASPGFAEEAVSLFSASSPEEAARDYTKIIYGQEEEGNQEEGKKESFEDIAVRQLKSEIYPEVKTSITELEERLESAQNQKKELQEQEDSRLAPIQAVIDMQKGTLEAAERIGIADEGMKNLLKRFQDALATTKEEVEEELQTAIQEEAEAKKKKENLEGIIDAATESFLQDCGENKKKIYEFMLTQESVKGKLIEEIETSLKKDKKKEVSGQALSEPVSPEQELEVPAESAEPTPISLEGLKEILSSTEVNEARKIIEKMLLMTGDWIDSNREALGDSLNNLETLETWVVKIAEKYGLSTGRATFLYYLFALAPGGVVDRSIIRNLADRAIPGKVSEGLIGGILRYAPSRMLKKLKLNLSADEDNAPEKQKPITLRLPSLDALHPVIADALSEIVEERFEGETLKLIPRHMFVAKLGFEFPETLPRDTLGGDLVGRIQLDKIDSRKGLSVGEITTLSNTLVEGLKDSKLQEALSALAKMIGEIKGTNSQENVFQVVIERCQKDPFFLLRFVAEPSLPDLRRFFSLDFQWPTKIDTFRGSASGDWADALVGKLLRGSRSGEQFSKNKNRFLFLTLVRTSALDLMNISGRFFGARDKLSKENTWEEIRFLFQKDDENPTAPLNPYYNTFDKFLGAEGAEEMEKAVRAFLTVAYLSIVKTQLNQVLALYGVGIKRNANGNFKLLPKEIKQGVLERSTSGGYEIEVPRSLIEDIGKRREGREERGDFYILVGPHGVGKSMLLKTLEVLAKAVDSDGNLVIQDEMEKQDTGNLIKARDNGSLVVAVLNNLKELTSLDLDKLKPRILALKVEQNGTRVCEEVSSLEGLGYERFMFQDLEGFLAWLKRQGVNP